MIVSKYGSDEILIAAYKKHGSCQLAANEIGCSRETIARAMRRNGLKLTGQHIPKEVKHRNIVNRKVTDAQLIEAAKTLTRNEICKKYNVTVHAVDVRLKRLGVKAKPGIGGFRRVSHYHERCNAYGVYCDDSITLEDVYKRDNVICKLCGFPVDKNDRNKNKIGRLYPSIDHIKPLSKGGAHTWDNVQLAHMKCNAGKCDRVALKGDLRGV